MGDDHVTVFRLLGDVIHQQAENKQILVLRLKFKTLMDCLYVLWIQIITKIFFHSFMVHKIAMFLHQKNYRVCLGPLEYTVNNYRMIIGQFIRKSFVIFIYR